MIPNGFRLARLAVGVTGIALFAVLAGFSILTHVAPLTGRELFIIAGGSMEPSIPIGSLVIATRTDPMTIAPGDIVTIRADNAVVITHRVRSVVESPDGRFFELQGDANTTPDGGLVPARAIVGVADLYLPYAGYARAFATSTPGLVTAVSMLVLLVLLYTFLQKVETGTRTTPARARAPADA